LLAAGIHRKADKLKCNIKAAGNEVMRRRRPFIYSLQIRGSIPCSQTDKLPREGFRSDCGESAKEKRNGVNQHNGCLKTLFITGLLNLHSNK
jgi:hypothetical protein